MRDDIQSELAEAFNDDLADAVHSFTCERVQGGEYNPITETVMNGSTINYSGRGVLFGSYQKDLVKPDNYQSDDAKATLLQNEVTATPEINDIWVKATSPTTSDSTKITADNVTIKLWGENNRLRVISIGKDPTDSIWVIQLRKT
ncbi:hypothetical protein I2F17_08990 [Acinetobacter sp. B10A]|nr:hypothetical protein [Acinetobacter baretiae]